MLEAYSIPAVAIILLFVPFWKVLFVQEVINSDMFKCWNTIPKDSKFITMLNFIAYLVTVLKTKHSSHTLTSYSTSLQGATRHGYGHKAKACM